ncbi:hypothetical protein yc1106_09565 [Curvularia clavata]|uniref:Bacteriophage T5 Orf172 DNA-binding domain-containing protein n=1 Tax=Curvularia clavata TaxID=95742 RepID=A0A9Q8ZHS0_CURCL|nr:hypothetical protein yc1106_09565 [Curvularia clavata]
MASMSFESARKPRGTRKSDVFVDGDAEVTSKHRKAQPSFKEDLSLLRDSITISTTRSSSGSSVRPQWASLAFDSLSDKRGPDLTTLLDPRNLSWSSSTAKTYNRFSPASSVGVWDLPETPPRLSDTPSPGQTWTPLTPPTPPSPSLERRKGSKLVAKKLKESYFDDAVGSNDVNSDWQEKDGFRPRKLFRNYTAELEKISKANAAAGQIKFNVEPSFDFSLDEAQPISSRTRSKTSKAVQLPASHDPIQSNDIPSVVVAPLVSGSELPSLLELILPLDLYKRLDGTSSTCIGSMESRSYARCSNSPRGSLGTALAIAGELARSRAEKDYETMVCEIEELVHEAMCGTHRNVVLKETKKGVRIEELRNHLYHFKTKSKIDRQALQQWLDTISNPKASADHIPWVRRAFEPTVVANLHSVPCKALGTPSKSIRTTPEPLRPAPNASKSNGQISSFADFTPFQLKKTKGIPVSDALIMEIKKPLGASETKSGFIYMFWDKRYFGKVKIGRTNDIKRRLKEWNKKCGKTHSYLSQDDRSCVEMPHVGRVERLIHTELKECREKRKCEGCETLHQEWFGENEVHAVKVVRKWQEWMMQRPYVMNATGQWELRPEMLESLGQVCEPLARDEVVVKQPRKSEGAKRSSRKKGGRKTM